MNPIYNLLCNKPNSSGSVAVHCNADIGSGAEDNEEVLYTLGKSYRGQARRNVKPHLQISHRLFKDRGNQSRQQWRRLCSSWLKGLEGWFDSSSNHMENEKHPREDVRASIKKLRDNQPTPVLTLDDVIGID